MTAKRIQKTSTNGWLWGALAALGVGAVAGASLAHAITKERPAHSRSVVLDGIQLPALDAMVARYAAEARAAHGVQIASAAHAH